MRHAHLHALTMALFVPSSYVFMSGVMIDAKPFVRIMRLLCLVDCYPRGKCGSDVNGIVAALLLAICFSTIGGEVVVPANAGAHLTTMFLQIMLQF